MKHVETFNKESVLRSTTWHVLEQLAILPCDLVGGVVRRQRGLVHRAALVVEILAASITMPLTGRESPAITHCVRRRYWPLLLETLSPDEPFANIALRLMKVCAECVLSDKFRRS